MQVTPLTLPELRNLYDTAMAQDFPPAERKPFSAMEALLRRGFYEPLLLTGTAGEPLAYALQVVAPGVPCALIDYFAVRADLRGGGVGTAALQLVKEYCAMRVQDLLLECEHPAEAPDPDAARRRIGFYLRAGARATALESRVFGTRYTVLSLPCGGTVPDAQLCKELRALYRVMVPHPYYRGQVIFYGS